MCTHKPSALGGLRVRIVESAEVDKSLLLALSAAEVMQDEPQPNQTRFTQTGFMEITDVHILPQLHEFLLCEWLRTSVFVIYGYAWFLNSTDSFVFFFLQPRFFSFIYFFFFFLFYLNTKEIPGNEVFFWEGVNRVNCEGRRKRNSSLDQQGENPVGSG